jgi:hypothetical protein
MRLPITVQNALEESERQMTGLLDRIGLDRSGLEGIAEQVRVRVRTEQARGVRASQSRRGGINV